MSNEKDFRERIDREISSIKNDVDAIRAGQKNTDKILGASAEIIHKFMSEKRTWKRDILSSLLVGASAGSIMLIFLYVVDWFTK